MQNQRKVLIVDSSPIVRHTLKKLVQTGDFPVDVAEADNAGQAIHIVTNESVDIVFLDIALSLQQEKSAEKNGIALIAFIKETAPDACVVVLTNLDAAEYEETARKNGADYFFSKERGSTLSLLKAFYTSLCQQPTS